MLTTGDRLDRLRAHIRQHNAGMAWWQNVRGLTLRFDFLKACGAGPEFLQQWRNGVALGATAAPPASVPNHPSVAEHGAWAAAEWDRLESLGKVRFFSTGRKPPGLNVNPCALLLKPREGADEAASEEERFKARLILDLRRGRVNERLPHITVAYGTVDRAVSKLSQGSFMFVLDLQDCFFNWRVQPSDSNLLGFYCPTRQQYGRYEYLPFGLATAPGVNGYSMKELLRLLSESQVDLLDFVDDLFGEGTTEEIAWARLEKAVEFFCAAGVPVSAKPTGIRPPCTRQRWIGWLFDTEEMVVTVPQEKCDKVCAIVADTLVADNARTLRAKELATTAGLCSHLGEIYPQARRRLHPVWADMNAAGVYSLWSRSPQANPSVQLSELSRKNLAWALKSLATPPRRTLHCQAGSLCNWGHKSPEYARWQELAREGVVRVIETDASSEHGWSYHLCHSGKVVSGVWPRDFASSEGIAEEHAEINYKELWVVVKCLLDQQQEFSGWRLLFRVDNTCAVHYVNVRYGNIPRLEALAEKLEAAERTASCWALAAHLKGTANRTADLGSRSTDFATQWNTDVFQHACVKEPVFRDVLARTGASFTLDLFADREGRTAKAPVWRSPERTAFEAPLVGEVIWAHPPRALLRPALEFLNAALRERDPPKVVLLCPEDPGAPWFKPQLLQHWHRVRSWPAASDLFRYSDGANWRSGPKTDLPYLLLQSWEPSRRKRKRT